MTHETPTEPRCATCDSVLLHVGAICHVCSMDEHYEAPPRTSPPMDLPERSEDLLAGLDCGVAAPQGVARRQPSSA